MPHKVVAINHQSFVSQVKSSKQYFRFSKVYKTNPNQRFILRPVSLMYYTDAKSDPEPHIFAISGLSGLNGEINQQKLVSTNGSTQTQTNKVVLGAIGEGIVSTNQGKALNSRPPEFLLKEIPLDDFLLESLHPDMTGSDTAFFLVSFQIDTIEDY